MGARTKCRLLTPIGTRYSLVGVGHDDLQPQDEKWGCHWGEIVLTKEEFQAVEGKPQEREYTCVRCGQKFTAESYASYGPLYDSEDGKANKPGDMFFTDFWMHDGKCRCGWDNCSGKHLVVILPDGHPWDTGRRANNCTRPDDRLHRCWVIEGTPPNVTVGKHGDTCSAGAGSILTPNWHGFLINGELVEC